MSRTDPRPAARRTAGPRGCPRTAHPRTVTAAARAAAARRSGVSRPRPERPLPSRPPRPRPRLPRARRARPRLTGHLPVLVLAALLVTAVAGAAVLGLRHHQAVQSRQAGEAAVAAAVEAAPVVFSYHHDRPAEDAAEDHLTGPFLAEYRRTAEAVARTARERRAAVSAAVAGGSEPAASVVSVAGDEAVVLLFVDQITGGPRLAGERVDLNRVRMILRHTAEGWKVSAVDAL